MTPQFGWRELFAGSRFLAPVSEQALLEAGRAAGLAEGETVLDLGCGNGAVCVFLAEEFHVYARGIDAAKDLVDSARGHAARSAAERRVRFYHEDPAHPDAGHGPVDVVCALRGALVPPAGHLRPGGRLILGRNLFTREPPRDLAEHFPVADVSPPAGACWTRDATPLEWERYYAPLERALRVYRRGLAAGAPLSPLALDIERQIAAFRAHGSYLAYRLSVVRVGSDGAKEAGPTERRLTPSWAPPEQGGNTPP